MVVKLFNLREYVENNYDELNKDYSVILTDSETIIHLHSMQDLYKMMNKLIHFVETDSNFYLDFHIKPFNKWIELHGIYTWGKNYVVPKT